MKILLLTLLFSTVALAEGGKNQNFAENKAKALKNIDARISALTQLKSCIGSASERADLKECRQKHKSNMEPLRSEWKEKRAKRKAQRKARKEQKDQD
ncbi:MAG: hypothetical protein CME65_03455 [Halobacteriovoraceae bacterium]|nr:hypothetical protein [Halobacteriovoraceae bacterium]|tara:strand:- start:9392 stop:9685 length:294 start_codon:yes stop_codon:yes gene_type:complete